MIQRKSENFSKKSVRTRSSTTAPSFFRLAHLLHLSPKFPKRPTNMRAGRKGGFRGEFRPALHLVFFFLRFLRFSVFCEFVRALGSNLGPHQYQWCALPTELCAQTSYNDLPKQLYTQMTGDICREWIRADTSNQ